MIEDGVAVSAHDGVPGGVDVGIIGLVHSGPVQFTVTVIVAEA